MVPFDVQMLSRSLIGGMEIQEFNRGVRERRAAKFAATIGLEQLASLERSSDTSRLNRK